MKAETVLNKLCEIKYRVEQICHVWITFWYMQRLQNWCG